MAKCGKVCEVFTRVVGFYRPLKWFNPGKKEEYRLRKEFTMPNVGEMPDVKSREKEHGQD